MTISKLKVHRLAFYLKVMIELEAQSPCWIMGYGLFW
jgi:hypothetical protein